MSDIVDYLATQPLTLPANVARVDAGGLPTRPVVAADTASRNWLNKAVVDLSTRVTTVQDQTDGNTASIVETQTALSNETSARAQRDLELTAITDATNATVSEIQIAYADADSALSGRIDTVTATANGVSASGQIQFVAVAAPSGYTAAYDLQLTVGATKVGLRLLANGAGVGSIALSANQLTMTDPAYNGGLPGNVFAYSGGVFTFNVPVSVRTVDLAANATLVWQEDDYPAQTLAAGVGSASGTLASWAVNGDQTMLLDVTCNLIMQFGAGSGATSDFALIIEVGGVGASFVRSIVSGIGTVSIDAVRKTGVAPGPRTISLKWTYTGNGPGSQARILAGSLSVFTLFKR